MAGKRKIHDAYWRRVIERTAKMFNRHPQTYAYGSVYDRADLDIQGSKANKLQRRTPIVID